MTLDDAIAELLLRRAEEAEAMAEGTWFALADAKRRQGLRRKRVHGLTRSQMKHWLELAAADLAARERVAA